MTLENLYLILPGLLGNLGAWAFGKFRLLNYPIDCNLKLKGIRLLGKNKTFKGIVASIVIASIANISLKSSFHLGALMGFAVAFGDSLKSFFKRRLKIREGRDWMPYDLLDLPIGYSIFIFPMLKTTIANILVCVALSISITFFAQGLWKKLNMKK